MMDFYNYIGHITSTYKPSIIDRTGFMLYRSKPFSVVVQGRVTPVLRTTFWYLYPGK